MALTFYHGHGSPYSWRVFLALEYLDVPYELKVLSFANKDTRKPEFIAINPRHTVPTITDDDVALWESIVILEYLDERFGHESAERLYPGTEAERARIRLLIRETEQYLELEGLDPITTEYFSKGDAPPDVEIVAKAKVRLGEEMQHLAGELQGKFLAGAQPTAADFVLLPDVAYVKRVAFRKPESKLTELIPAPLAAWLNRMEALPFYDKAYPPHWR
jgi:glutathione S-transferase